MAPASSPMFEVTIEEMLACVERELAFRARVYPRWVAQKKLTQATADEEMRRMDAVREALPALGAARELLEAMATTKLRDWNMPARMVTLHFSEDFDLKRFLAAFDAAEASVRGVVRRTITDGRGAQ